MHDELQRLQESIDDLAGATHDWLILSRIARCAIAWAERIWEIEDEDYEYDDILEDCTTNLLMAVKAYKRTQEVTA